MKGYAKGVCFHTSANKPFGGKTKPTSVNVGSHTRAAPVRAQPQAQNARAGGPGRR